MFRVCLYWSYVYELGLIGLCRGWIGRVPNLQPTDEERSGLPSS